MSNYITGNGSKFVVCAREGKADTTSFFLQCISQSEIGNLAAISQAGRYAFATRQASAVAENDKNGYYNQNMSKYDIKLKRVYEKAEESDGFRILIDRLWPRGISKEKAKIDLWLKDIAPSNELRKWFVHDPAKWNEFQKRYKKELLANKSAVQQLKEIIKKEKKVTLLFSASDEKHNNAAALVKILKL